MKGVLCINTIYSAVSSSSLLGGPLRSCSGMLSQNDCGGDGGAASQGSGQGHQSTHVAQFQQKVVRCGSTRVGTTHVKNTMVLM